MESALVPIDGSPASLRALATALAHLPSGSRLHLLNVQAAELHAWPGQPAPQELDAQSQERGMAVLQQAKDMTLGSGVNVVLHVKAGHIAGEIAKCADEQGCEAIVMGTRGMGAAAGIALGSVATKVVQLSRLPVTLVK